MPFSRRFPCPPKGQPPFDAGCWQLGPILRDPTLQTAPCHELHLQSVCMCMYAAGAALAILFTAAKSHEVSGMSTCRQNTAVELRLEKERECSKGLFVQWCY